MSHVENSKNKVLSRMTGFHFVCLGSLSCLQPIQMKLVRGKYLSSQMTENLNNSLTG